MYTIEMKEEAMLPRERLVDYGAERLSNQELLAILLRTGTRTNPVLEVSHHILKNMTSLADFRHLSLQELQQIKGIGSVKSVEIKAMIELANRINKAEYAKEERIMSSQRLAKKMMLELSDKKQEHLVTLYLDTQNRIIEQKTIFIGTVRRSIAEPREILHYAIKNMATSLIVSHNHPSGSIEPSREDNKFTETLRGASDLLGVTLLDHLIVTDSKYYSYREENNIL